MINIFADDKIPFLKGVLDSFADMTYLPGGMIGNEQLRETDALIIRTRTKCSEDLLKGTKVSFIGTATIGFDHIDVQYCENNNIKWTNSPGCNSSSVQQYIASSLLKMSGDFRFRLRDKTIGIIGVGNVGSKVEKLAGIFGMKVLLNDPPRARNEGAEGFVDLETLLKVSDIITVHVPLNTVGEDITYRLINDKSVRKMKKGVWLINTSRGEVADTSSLKNGLKSGKFSGVVLDVWENEPDIDYELLEKAFIATPHIAGYSTDGKANGTAMVVNALSKFFKFPLRNWYPEHIPQPHNNIVELEAENKDPEDLIREAVFHTYNISEDDIKLRFSPNDFEKHRGDYPVRREFPAFGLNLRNASKDTRKMFEELGFKLIAEKL